MILLETEMPAPNISDIDHQLEEYWLSGQHCNRMVMGADALVNLSRHAEEVGTLIQVRAEMEQGVCVALAITGYVHPITGDVVAIAGDASLGRDWVRFEDTEE
jgi:hypothetical protein